MQEISRISEEERQLKIDKYHTGVLQWNMKVVETLMDLGYDLSFEKLMKVFEKIYTTAKLSKALSTQTAAGIRYLTKEIEDL